MSELSPEEFQDLLQRQIPKFVFRVIKSLKSVNIDPSPYFLDHACYRTETMEQYMHVSQILQQIGRLLIKGHIGGRPISTFKLTKAIHVGQRSIDVIELASPKKGSYYPTGLEHVEFVVNDLSLNEFMLLHPSLEWNAKGISKIINPDIRLDFDGFSVKFHNSSLEVCQSPVFLITERYSTRTDIKDVKYKAG